MVSEIKNQAERIFSLAEIAAEGFCTFGSFADRFVSRSPARMTIEAVIAVSLLREVLASSYICFMNSGGNATLVDWARFEKYLHKVGERRYRRAFAGYWRSSASRLDIAGNDKHRQELLNNGFDAYLSSGIDFVRDELAILGVDTSDAQIEAFKYLRMKIRDFCFRTNDVLNFRAWDVQVDETEKKFEVVSRRYDIFVTYRRSDGLNVAQLLYQALTARGYRCYLDVRDEQDGDYERRILAALREAPNYIVLVTEGLIARLTDKDNCVCREIREALGAHKKVILVAPDGMTRSLYGVEMLPEFDCLRPMSISRLSLGELFEESVDAIIRRFPMRKWPRRIKLAIMTGLGLLLVSAGIVLAVALADDRHDEISPEKYLVVDDDGVFTDESANEPPDVESEEVVSRMKRMRLPTVTFKPPATIIDAMEFFRGVSKDYDDPTLPVDKRGLKLVLRASFDNEPGSIPVIPMLTASDVSFYDMLTLVCDSVGYKFRVVGGVIYVGSANSALVNVQTCEYVVSPKMSDILLGWETLNVDKLASSEDYNNHGNGTDPGEDRLNYALRGFFSEFGVSWYEESRVNYIPAANVLIVRSTDRELHKIACVLSRLKVLQEFHVRE